jgi:hypothetical protein
MIERPGLHANPHVLIAGELRNREIVADLKAVEAAVGGQREGAHDFAMRR